MVNVNTVLGPVPVTALGTTLVHEHMRIRSDEVFRQFPHLFDDARELAVAIKDVRTVQSYGVQSILDPTVFGLGRDVDFLRRISDATGIHLLTATGIYTYGEIPNHFKNQSIDYMTDIFLRDIEVGIQGTAIKPAFLKCSTDTAGMTPDIEKVIRACARASRATGLPIMTHSVPHNRSGLEQVYILLEEGVLPEQIIIGHAGDTVNLFYIRALLQAGVFIGMDRYGLDYINPTDVRNDTLLTLLAEGYAAQMFLSQDYCCNTDWYSDEVKHSMSPKWRLDYLLTDIIPALRARGMTEEQHAFMMKHNVVRWLSSGQERRASEASEAGHARGAVLP
jgi:phosphotriesterase-related protein